MRLIRIKEEGLFKTVYDPSNGYLFQYVDDAFEGEPVKYPSPNLVDLKITDFCSLGCHFCAIPGSLVATSVGHKPIQDVMKGDRVVSYDVETSSFVEDEVVYTMVRDYVGEVLSLELEDGGVLTVTPDHPILTKRGWVSAGDLEMRDEVIAWSKKFA